jgi:hypothetical protein
MFEHMQQLEPKNMAAYEKNVHEERSIDNEGVVAYKQSGYQITFYFSMDPAAW